MHMPEGEAVTTIIRESRPVARKAHRCNLCGGPIAVGERYIRLVMRYDDFYEWIECGACMADHIGGEVDEWGWYDDERGYGVDDANEWAHEHATHPALGEAARRWLTRNGCDCEACEARAS